MAFLAVAATVSGLPVATHLASPEAGVAVGVALACLLAHLLPAAVPAALIGSYVFQNLFVSLVSPWIGDAEQFNAIRAYNFLLTAVVWVVLAGHAFAGWNGLAQRVRGLLVLTSLGLALIGFYLVIGLAGDPKSAVVYLRNVATPLIVFQACLVAATRSPGGLARSLLPIGVILVAYSYAELFLRGPLFDLINADHYIVFRMQQETDAGVFLKEMQETGRVIRGFEDAMTVDLFNTPLLANLKIQIYRPMGPNFHAISYAYALSFFGLLFAATRRPFLAAATILPMLVIGSKGALATLVFGVVAPWAARRIRGSLVMGVFLAALALYLALAIVVGLNLGDYHVLGLIGGLKGFLQNPFGHGLGAGGNLSLNMTAIDWSRSQAMGETDRAVESAIGVLLYQMGVAGAVLCLLYVRLGAAVWRLSGGGRRPLPAMVTFAVLTVTANGLLQEEALFAPLAMASFLALAAILLGDSQAAPAPTTPSRAPLRPRATAVLSPPRDLSPAPARASLAP
jgi:hypothetical protein